MASVLTDLQNVWINCKGILKFVMYDIYDDPSSILFLEKSIPNSKLVKGSKGERSETSV